MKTSDIPTRPILEFLRWVNSPHDPNDCFKEYEWTADSCKNGIWANWYFGGSHCVQRAMTVGIPEKLVLSKMRNLIKRNLVDGCPCGCRGDYVLTETGKKYLNATN